jgi:hypothetical protein
MWYTPALPRSRRGIIICHAYKATITVFTTAAVMIFLAYDRRPPITFENGMAITGTVSPGETAKVDWTVKVSRPCQGEIKRSITGSNGVVHPYEPRPEPRPVPPPAPPSPVPYERTSDVPVPMGVPSGEAKYRVAVSFDDCGVTSRWVPIVVNAPTVPIEIASNK